MTHEKTIPMLPCRSIDDTLTFYRALGFEVTYEQSRPNTYAVVQRGDVCLHFFALKLDPADSYSSCLVVVSDVDRLYREFAAGLRQQYGKLLIAGIPRMTRLKDKSGGRGFNVVDPGGNWIRISQPSAESNDETSKDTPAKSTATKLSRALHAADLLAEHGDFAAAAKMLDAALAHDDPAPASQRVQALILRANVAINMNDLPLAHRLLIQMRQIVLTEEEYATLTEAFQNAADLESLLQ